MLLRVEHRDCTGGFALCDRLQIAQDHHGFRERRDWLLTLLCRQT